MINSKKILAVIPARGGSKGIPRKNLRLLAGQPLISYVINAAKKSHYIDTVVVSSEDEAIIETAKQYSARTIQRPLSLSGDTITLDPVIYHAWRESEKLFKIRYQLIITLQPTTPLLKSRTLDNAIEKFITSQGDTLISVMEERHLYWQKIRGKSVPMFKERKNRQNLEPLYREAGAIVISARNNIKEDNRFGKDILLYTMPQNESVDIDTIEDWHLVEHILNRKNVIFRVDGNKNLGLGHIYRTINLALNIFGYNVHFLTKSNYFLGLQKIKEFNLPVTTFINEQDMFRKLEQLNASIVINDILDTSKRYIERLKKKNYFVVNFEDLGNGSKIADLVFNALYEFPNPPKNHYYGYKYESVRDEFFIFPSHKIKERVNNVCITFGGTDPCNLALKTLESIHKQVFKKINFYLILGLGYRDEYKDKLKKYIKKMNGYKIIVKEDVRSMASLLSKADIVITSNGRTVYEVACLGIPCIAISQNKRELTHGLSQNCFGIKNLGLGKLISKQYISSVLLELINNQQLRKIMSDELLKLDIKNGTRRILHLIFSQFTYRNNIGS